jgi:uncharacterized protein YhjY with autotransporter beta-barrel domain
MDIASNGEALPRHHAFARAHGGPDRPRHPHANWVEHRCNERDLAGICPQPSIVPCGVAAKWPQFALLAASCLAPLSLGLSEPALAQCTPLDASGNATCTPAGNPYPTGINYNTNNGLGGTPINLTLLPGVNVAIPPGPGGVNAVNAANTTGVTLGSANIGIFADGVTINNTANPLGNNNTGLRIQSSGDAVINATNTAINVNGIASEDAIVAFSMPNLTGTSHVASATWSGSSITSSGTESTGIQADNRGAGNATIGASGNIAITPGVGQSGVYGLIAHSGDSLFLAPQAGDASVTYRTGTINAFGDRPRGIVVWAEGDGSATVTTDPGTVIKISGTNNPGIDLPTLPVAAGISLQLDSATAANGRAITANVASQIMNFGAAAPGDFFRNPTGIRALSYANAPITVNYTGPGITTQGGGGVGIMALSGNGSMTVNVSGPIDTMNGSNAVGILADSGTILAQENGLLTDTTTIRPGIVLPTSTTGSAQINAANVSALGQFGTAISATSGIGGVTINIAQGGSITGGWQADLTSVGPIYGLQATGIILASTGGTATLINDGTIGALSDRAVAGDPIIINNGAITGFVQFVGGNNSILNDGTFNLRHFADTNGDGVRDTVRVAIADLGAGPGNTFTNNGTLALLGVPGAITLDATGQYLPLGFSFNAMALGGPVQGQILGVATFTNSSTIDLQANPVAGDVLVISGGRTPGSNGGGTFISNGGRLLIDTVLNAGGTASRSDVLVVDNAVVGAGGATSLFVRNAGGAGALTISNGILVVQGLGTTAPGTFSLGSPVEAGAFSYLLFRGSVDASGPQNWYLRSTFSCALAPDDPACVTPPEPTPPPVAPDFRPAVPLYTALSLLAMRYGFGVIGTLHERMGDPYAMVDPGSTAPPAYAAPTVHEDYLKAAPAVTPTTSPPAVWGRLLGDFGKRDNDNFFAAGPDYMWNLGGVQTGFDLWCREERNGAHDHAGLYGAFGTIESDVQRAFRSLGPTAGSITMNAASLGGYWTHYGPGGWYVDAVTQGTWYGSNARSVTGPALSTNGLGWAGSLEGGYPIALTRQVLIEPQAQLIYQHVRLDNGNDGDALVSFSNSDALEGRLGARLVKTWNMGASFQPRPLVTWLRANLWHEFFEGTDTTLAGLSGANAFTFTAPLKGTWAEIGGGATGTVARSTTLFATAAYQHNTDGDHQYAWTGRAGVTMRW